MARPNINSRSNNSYVVLFYDNYSVILEIRCKHFFYGCPEGTPAANNLLIHGAYVLSPNDQTESAG